MLSRIRILGVAVATLAAALPAQSPFPTATAANLRWRMIGPFRGGRTKSGVGVPSQPNVFYMAPSNGGVWKTTDYGRTWNPIFDDQPSQSIGAIDVAPSNPNVIYVGSGEGLQRPDLSTGDGMWRSDDAGKHWRHVGLEDAQQIPRITTDPHDPDRVFVAALGHPYGPNAERGVFRSTNGGRSWQKVLYVDENTGAADIVMSPGDPNTLYAAMWEARQGPWENGAFSGPGTALYKTTDGGNTWTKLAGGLPTTADGLGRIGIAISPSLPSRLYLTATAGAKSGIWRTDDAGANWYRITDDNRIYGRGDDFAALGRLAYDLARREGSATNVSSSAKSGEVWYVEAHQAAFASGDSTAKKDNVFYGASGQITSCQDSVPHYHFSASELKRVSSPGLRTYVGATEIPRVRNGLGVAILSTSKGLMTDRQARAQRTGGELLALVW